MGKTKRIVCRWLSGVVLTVCCVGSLSAQNIITRLYNRFLNDTTASNQPHLALYPTIAYAPETSLEIGASALYLYHANNDTVNNRLSELQAFGFVTLLGQYGLNLDNTVFGDRDRWYFLGRARFQRFPLLYYGIGPDAHADNPATVDAFSIQARQRVMRRIHPNLFGGLVVDLQHLSNVAFQQPEGTSFTLPRGSGGSTNLGLGVGLIYDSRPNVLNARKGAFAELTYLNYHPTRASTYAFSNMLADVRLYKTVRPNQVLAWQAYGVLAGGDAPFNQLALLGGETIMRGYYLGRYRDKVHAATQLEYRWLPFWFSKRIGAAVFAAVGTVAPSAREIRLDNLLPAGGAGVRYLLFKKKDVFLRFDVGFTREGTGFYILTGESF